MDEALAVVNTDLRRVRILESIERFVARWMACRKGSVYINCLSASAPLL